MSIFGKIKTAIFGEHGPLGGQFSGRHDAPAASASPGQAPAVAPTPTPAAAQAAPTPQAAPVTQQPVDVSARLEQLSASKGNPNLNYKTSIVDLMKLLDLDPSLANRKELATELGYTGAKDGSAEMNIWLHKAVMSRLDETKG